MDAEKCCAFHAEWFFGCYVKMRHFSVVDAGDPLYDVKRRADTFDASSCIEDTSGSSYGCSINDITEAELLRRSRTYCNV